MSSDSQPTVKPGDRARLIRMPDIVNSELKKIFEKCVGHVFPVGDVLSIEGVTLIDLEIGELFGRKSYMESIYVEYDCVEVIND